MDWKLERDTVTLYPQGDLDLVTSKKVRETLDAILCSRGNIKQLIIDLADVQFIDSSGLGMLIGCYKTMCGRQGKMMICDASDHVYRILELSGMKKLMLEVIMSSEPVIDFFGAVFSVTHNTVADRSQMGADLMCPSGNEFHL